jgi:hypothetical protein
MIAYRRTAARVVEIKEGAAGTGLLKGLKRGDRFVKSLQQQCPFRVPSVFVLYRNDHQPATTLIESDSDVGQHQGYHGDIGQDPRLRNNRRLHV